MAYNGIRNAKVNTKTKRSLLKIAKSLKKTNAKITMLSIKDFARNNNIDVENIKFETTYYLLRSHGYNFKKSNECSIERRMEMAKLTHQGLTFQQIGEKYGITRQAVSLVLQKAAKEGMIVVKAKSNNKNPEKNVIIISRSVQKFFDCVVCGNKFKSGRTARKKSCSKACLDELTKARRGGEWSRHETVDLNCANCGEVFKRTKYLFQITMRNKKSSNHYCSRKCYEKPRCRGENE